VILKWVVIDHFLHSPLTVIHEFIVWTPSCKVRLSSLRNQDFQHDLSIRLCLLHFFKFFIWLNLSQPHFGLSVRMKPTFPKVGTWSPSGLPKIQSSIAGVKTPRIGVFFIPLERNWSVDVQNGLTWAIWTFAAQVMGKRRVGSQFDSRPLKVGNRPESDFCRRSATWHWKALKESYKISSYLIPIQGLRKKLWMPKVPGVQTGTVSGLLLESPRRKCHSDVATAESCREYYMGEGGGFPRVRAMVSQVSPVLPVACHNTKGALECELTNFLVGLMKVRVSE
jgi:hypothetical protein